jgi:hypothetical protein
VPYLDLEAATASVTTAYPTFTALAACTGDTLTVRSLSQAQKAMLIDFGMFGAAGEVVRVRSPYLHDDVNGIRSRFLAADPSGLTGWEPSQTLRAQDTLIVEGTGSGSAAQYVYWQLVYYSDLNGGPSTYITQHELESRMIEETSTEVAVTSSATAGQWGSALLSTGTGIWKANQQYAVFGYELDVACAAVGLYGPDTGNFRAGGPGVLTRQFTRNWFIDLAENTGLPTIPVINAQNLAGTQVQVVHYTASTAVNVNLLLARLKS